MDKRTLSVVKRTSVGKNSLKSLRKEGFIPAVMYGHSDNTLFSVNEREFGKKFKVISENTIIDLKDGKDVYHVLIKDFDEDVLKGNILHLDFYEVEKGKSLNTIVPLHIEGSSVGVRLGGSLETLVHEIQVECLPKDIPEEIIVNIENLEIGQSIHVKDLAEIKGVKFLTSPEQVITHVTKAGAAAIEEDEAETVEE
ncbi:50S ribosomal protein L25 [Thiospirochaeta perfilievii]|uniref:Large ribosomal subunit protein bL25 n=1 Tax=Thiospirochaeta perfilievii TaxID=252967 RepID=A0A5C1QGL9_9SPIO|nr:50S ribosomal protein L25 [Thiospirochaeta perfilievii]QEN06220.1 50S ribosomal protein L25 [Thiospirochaeta perfilievii]